MIARTKNACWIIIAGSAACLLYFWVARILLLDYGSKSLIKLALFLGLPLLYLKLRSRVSWRAAWQLIIPRKEQLPHLLGALAAGALIIAAANLLVEPLCRFFGIASIIAEIRARTQTTRLGLWLAIIYIPLINALAEELFFRGFCVLELLKLDCRRLGLIFPAVLFALYHLAIFQNWFSPGIMVLALSGLFLCGLLLGHFVRRDQNIVGVWLLHGLVNIAILSVGLRFF